MDLFALLYFVGAAQAAILGVTLISLRRSNAQANLFIGLFLVVFSFELFEYFLVHSEFYRDVPFIVAFSFPFSFAYGPLIYFYVRLLTGKDAVFTRRMALHFIPVAIGAIFWMPVFGLTGADKVALIEHPEQTSEIFANTVYSIAIIGNSLAVIETANVLLPFFYLTLAYRLISQHRRDVKHSYSSLERVNLAWLQRLFVLVAGLCVIYFITFVIHASAAIQNEYIDNQSPLSTILPIAMALAALYLGVKALRQPAIYHFAPDPSPSTNDHPTPPTFSKSKYRKSSLDNAQSTVIQLKLCAMMEKDKLYADANLTLPALAERLSVSPHQLSQVLNETINQSFFDFVNYYRIEAAKRLLADPNEARSSIESIALEVGYKSKSAFYRLFKESTGTTPAQFRDQHLLASAPENAN